jgi:hypothetical protein
MVDVTTRQVSMLRGPSVIHLLVPSSTTAGSGCRRLGASTLGPLGRLI